MQSNQTENPKRPKISTTSSTHSIRSQTKTQSNQIMPTPTFNQLGKIGDPILAKKRNRNLLRDYYGLSSNSKTNDMDSIEFNHQLWFQNLINQSTSSDIMLKNVNQIMNEMRELDGERQSLVYHHHHELVDASLMIGKMKNSTETLDNSLNELQNQFSSISETIHSISNSMFTQSKKPIPSSSNPISSKEETEVNRFILPILSLPIILKTLIQASNKIKSDQLWGEWEISLKTIEDSGLVQIQKVSNECREILKQSRTLISKCDFN